MLFLRLVEGGKGGRHKGCFVSEVIRVASDRGQVFIISLSYGRFPTMARPLRVEFPGATCYITSDWILGQFAG